MSQSEQRSTPVVRPGFNVERRIPAFISGLSGSLSAIHAHILGGSEFDIDSSAIGIFFVREGRFQFIGMDEAELSRLQVAHFSECA